jgi:hypothetical protein
MLITLAEFKDRLGEASTEYDAKLTLIIASITAQFEAFCGRGLIVTAAAVTEYYTGRCEMLQLRRYPVVSITSIKEAWDYDFANATALVADTDYRLIGGGDKGLLLRMYGDWCHQPDGVQAVYRGGYTAAGTTPGTGETAVPADLTEAALEQGLYLSQRKGRDIGLSGQSFAGGGFTKIETGDIIDAAQKILRRSYMRIVM